MECVLLVLPTLLQAALGRHQELDEGRAMRQQLAESSAVGRLPSLAWPLAMLAVLEKNTHKYSFLPALPRVGNCGVEPRCRQDGQ